jgi:Cu(I)/Ag(I) efflux system membrane fusion protein
VEVTLGATVGEYVEILSGLAPGQRVVTSAQFLLDSESNLAEVMKEMAGMGGGKGAAPPASAGAASDLKGVDMKGMDKKSATSPTTPR